MKTPPYLISECINLPTKWWDKASSIWTTGCVILYSEENCASEKAPVLFSSVRSNINEVYYSQPDKIPNKNFVGTW